MSVPPPPPTETLGSRSGLVDLRDPGVSAKEGLVEIFVNGEKSIDAANCQERSIISRLCPNAPPPPPQGPGNGLNRIWHQ